MKILWRKYSRRSVYIKYILSYMLMLVIPISISLTSYFKYVSKTKDEIKSFSYALVEQTRDVVDERLSSIDEMVSRLSNEPNLTQISYVSKELESKDIIAISKAIDLLNNYTTASKYVKNIYVYYSKPDFILSTGGKTSDIDFYNNRVKYEDWSFGEWKNNLKQLHYLEYFPSQNILINDVEQRRYLTMLHTFPAGSKGDSYATLGVVINTLDFFDLIDKNELLKKGAVCIVDEHNQKIFSIGNEMLLRNLEIEPFNEQNKSFYQDIENTQAIITYATSNLKPWRYIAVIPSSVFVQKIQSYKNITFIITLLFLIFGMILAMTLAKKNYKPIKNLLASLIVNKVLTPEDEYSENEIGLLKKITENTINESEKMKESIRVNMPLLRSSILRKLIEGNYTDESEISPDILGKEGITFISDYFCIIAVKIDSKWGPSMEDMALTRFSIINVMEELCEKKDRVYSLEYTTDILMILLNMGEVTDTKQLFIDQIVNKTQQFFNDKFGILITFGIGNIYNGLEGIHKSYLQALECIEHQLIYGKNCIIDYEKLSTEKKLNFNYPLDMEVQLINSIKLGKYKESCEILNQLYKINFSEGIMSINMTRCLFFDIMSTVIKVLKELETYQEKSIISGTIQIEQLLSCRNVDEMWLMAKQIIGDICTFINNQDEDHLLFTKISEFIDKQLTNANLNVTMIADAFQITSSYLSVFFKSHGHDTLKSYINKRRVELAKELLKDEYTLIEIAEKIGYSNDIVLIRNFKRFENMTPSEYRSLFKRE